MSARSSREVAGFTLVEVAVALFLISMVTTYGVLSFNGYFQRAAAQRASRWPAAGPPVPASLW